MGREGINILNDVVYITASIMGSIEGKSREYCAGRADGETSDPVAVCRLRGRAGAEGQAALTRIRKKEAVNQGFPDFERRIQSVS